MRRPHGDGRRRGDRRDPRQRTDRGAPRARPPGAVRAGRAHRLRRGGPALHADRGRTHRAGRHGVGGRVQRDTHRARNRDGAPGLRSRARGAQAPALRGGRSLRHPRRHREERGHDRERGGGRGVRPRRRRARDEAPRGAGPPDRREGAARARPVGGVVRRRGAQGRAGPAPPARRDHAQRAPRDGVPAPGAPIRDQRLDESLWIRTYEDHHTAWAWRAGLGGTGARQYARKLVWLLAHRCIATPSPG